jgi:hypothetical protein
MICLQRQQVKFRLWVSSACALQAERQKVLLAHSALCAPAEARCEKSELVFQKKWWGRRTPLQRDPRKIVQPSGSHALDSPRAHEHLAPDDRPGCGCAPRRVAPARTVA